MSRRRYIAVGLSRWWLPITFDWRGWRWFVRWSNRRSLWLLRCDTERDDIESPDAWRAWQLTPHLRRAPTTPPPEPRP